MALSATQQLALNQWSQRQSEFVPFSQNSGITNPLLAGENIELGDILAATTLDLPTVNAANGFLKRNSGNTAWEEVAYGTASNTVAQGNDSRITGAFQSSKLTPGSTLTPAGATQTISFASTNNAVLSLASATGDVTLTLTNPVAGNTYTIRVTQGAVTRNLIWPSPAVLWPAGTPPIISATSGSVDLITLYYDGAKYLGTFQQTYA